MGSGARVVDDSGDSDVGEALLFPCCRHRHLAAASSPSRRRRTPASPTSLLPTPPAALAD